MTPEQAILAAKDLQANALMPAHVGRFSISNHPWYEPFKRITDNSQDPEFDLFTPDHCPTHLARRTRKAFYSLVETGVIL